MELRILGGVEAVVDAVAVTLGPPMQRAVLVELIRSRGVVPREALIEALWADPPKSVVGSLQVYVHGLRRVLGETRIETIGTAYRLRLEPDDRVDADTFTELVDRARRSLDDERAAAALRDVEEALALWRGGALADVASLGSLAGYARELEERRFEAYELRNEAWLGLGRHELVLDEITRLIADEPFRERLRAQQIVALYRDGRQADALAAYRATRETWIEELGIEPTRLLRDLERSVLDQDETLAAPSASATHRRVVPSPATPLVGRHLEIATVAALLRSQARLVTLVGAGGTGKTRLAIAVADELLPELRDGIVFVDFSPVTDPQLLGTTIAQALEVGEPGALAERLAGQELLLVLDNLEQLVDGAEEIGALLTAAAGIRILATSRTPLRLAGEHEYPVLPLLLPPIDAQTDEIPESEAVQLFVARARAAGRDVPADASVAALCRRLDGLPLALELAAARTKLLSPREILARLDRDPTLLASRARDVPTRHSTLAATIQWSLDLLDDDARAAFGRLGVFAGGFTVEAADRIGVDLELLTSLVDKSLLQRREDRGRPRLVMLETVKPFAVALLDDDTRRLHAEWLVEVAEGVESELGAGGDTAAQLDDLEAEADNIRAALEWTLGSGRVDLALRLISASRLFWEIRGRLPEATRWLTTTLDVAGTDWPELRVKVLGFAGVAAFRRGELDDAERYWQAMLELYEELGDRTGIARGFSDVGTVAAARGDWDRSRELLEQAAVLFRELGISKRLAVVLSNLGHVAGQVGDNDGGMAYTLEALELQREAGEDQGIAISLNNLGSFAALAGDHAAALRWLAECFELALRIGYREVLAHALVTRAHIADAEGDAALGAHFAAVADAAFEDGGVAMAGTEAERFVALKDQLRTSLGDDAYASIRAEVAATSIEDALRQAAPSVT